MKYRNKCTNIERYDYKLKINLTINSFNANKIRENHIKVKDYWYENIEVKGKKERGIGSTQQRGSLKY